MAGQCPGDDHPAVSGCTATLSTLLAAPKYLVAQPGILAALQAFPVKTRNFVRWSQLCSMRLAFTNAASNGLMRRCLLRWQDERLFPRFVY